MLSSILTRDFTGIYHAMAWPQMQYVAEDHKGRVVGYVLGTMYVSLPMSLPSRFTSPNTHLILPLRDRLSLKLILNLTCADTKANPEKTKTRPKKRTKSTGTSTPSPSSDLIDDLA